MDIAVKAKMLLFFLQNELMQLNDISRSTSATQDVSPALGQAVTHE
jgi:hypothetical protein